MPGPIDIAAFVRHGLAVVVATRDEQRHPEVARAWGPSLNADGSRLMLCVEGAPDSPMARNLAAGSPLAATLSRLASHSRIQLKGPVLEVGAPGQERLAAAAEHVERFVAETAKVGVREPVARALVGSQLIAVTMEVAERYDDTPGSGMGRPL